MKNITYFFILISMAAVIASCKKPIDFVVNGSTRSGGQLPVSSNTLVDMLDNVAISGRKYAAGTTFKTEIQFYSVDAVQEINLYETIGAGTRNKVADYPYVPAYSPIKKLDTLLVPYTVGAALASGTSIKLEYEILNVNTLNLVRPATITVK
jgi:hypothetical protein